MDRVGFGLWPTVILGSAFVILIAGSLFHPKSRRDWKAMGAFSGFVVALFAEMFGFPLTLYLLSGWLGSRFPELTITHRGGHIWNDLIGWKADPHISPFHIASYVAIIGGLVLIGRAWPVLWRATRDGKLASAGPYSRMRHPQYSGLMLVMVGWLLQWPTIPTILMFPILAFLYRRLAIAEELEVRASFGEKWDEYARTTPRFIPRLRAEWLVRR